jgi:DNA-binding NtrC family response regulator
MHNIGANALRHAYRLTVTRRATDLRSTISVRHLRQSAAPVMHNPRWSSMSILAIVRAPEQLQGLQAALAPCRVVAVGEHEGLSQLCGTWSAVLLDTELETPVLPLVERLSEAGTAVALLTRAPTMQLTLQALAAGAADVLALPPNPERVADIAAADCARRAAAVPLARASVTETQVVGRSTALLDAFRTVARVARSTATVLIRGESGTGKELFARLIHEQSARSRAAFIAVNCAAIPEHLLESELFGHEKGAFTGALARRIGRMERASGGTLFLDEVADMSLALQAKVLRALQEREIERVGSEHSIRVDVRFVAATNRDLEADVASGRFREDLYYRLNVVPLELPPLRVRGDDVRLLSEYYLDQSAREHGLGTLQLAAETLSLLKSYEWPGNVRQLRNVMERAALLAEGRIIRPSHLPEEVRSPAGRSEFDAFGTLAEVEQRYIQRVLSRTGGHMTRAADVLGIHRNTLRRKLEIYGLA